MSRSKKKTSIHGYTCAESEKEDKRFNNRKIRRAIKKIIKTNPEIFPHEKELTNPWDMSKDGKHYLDSGKHPKLMRK